MAWEDIIKQKGLEHVIDYLEDASKQDMYDADLLRKVCSKAALMLKKLQ